MTEIEGIIERVSTKDNSYGLFISNQWYNGWGATKLEKGDRVALAFELSEDGQWKNIKQIEKIGESLRKEAEQKTTKEWVGTAGGTPFIPASEYYKQRDDMIIRQVAFKGGIEMVKALMEQKGETYSFEGLVQAVKDYTDKFEKIIIGMD